jgi:hypothetical protein
MRFTRHGTFQRLLWNDSKNHASAFCTKQIDYSVFGDRIIKPVSAGKGAFGRHPAFREVRKLLA